jgi:putative intracellular protease/amidase
MSLQTSAISSTLLLSREVFEVGGKDMKGFREAFLLFALLATATVPTMASSRSASAIVGDWAGTIDTGGKVMQVLLHVRLEKDGTLSATADNISQGELEIHVDQVKFASPRIHLEIEQGAGIYDGVLDEKGMKIVGDWKQGNAVFPLHFRRVTDDYVRSITPHQVQVAFLISNNFNVMDFAGPWEVFQDAMSHSDGNMRSLTNVYTVSANRDPLKTTGGATVVPRYTFQDVPQPDIIVVGAQSSASDEVLNWLRKMNQARVVIMSVCTGAAKLAAAGLIDGHPATTHHEYLDAFKKQYPNVQWQSSKRYVQSSDNIFTAAGLTSGIDLALHLLETRFGRDVAEATALYMEYHGTDWRQAQ